MASRASGAWTEISCAGSRCTISRSLTARARRSFRRRWCRRAIRSAISCRNTSSSMRSASPNPRWCSTRSRRRLELRRAVRSGRHHQKGYDARLRLVDHAAQRAHVGRTRARADAVDARRFAAGRRARQHRARRPRRKGAPARDRSARRLPERDGARHVERGAAAQSGSPIRTARRASFRWPRSP